MSDSPAKLWFSILEHIYLILILLVCECAVCCSTISHFRATHIKFSTLSTTVLLMLKNNMAHITILKLQHCCYNKVFICSYSTCIQSGSQSLLAIL